MSTTIDALVEALENILSVERTAINDSDAWTEIKVTARAALALARAEQAEPVKYATLENLKNWSLLAARALDDCHRVIETIEAESTEEENSLTELDARVYNLFNQALVMNGLLTRTQLDKATPFNRIELSATPPAAPAKLEPWMVHARKLTQWRHCMSYNDSYFGESPGLLKHITAELERLLPEEPLEAAHNAKLGGAG